MKGHGFGLDPDLLELLACPSDDHAPLREDDARGDRVLVCTYCASIFRVDDGIPVLLLDEATPGPRRRSASPPRVTDLTGAAVTGRRELRRGLCSTTPQLLERGRRVGGCCGALRHRRAAGAPAPARPRGDFGVERLRAGRQPRAVLVATDAPPPSAQRLVTRLSCEPQPALAWHGVELPRWAGPADALLIGAIDGRHPRLAELAEQAARRGLAMAVVAPAGSSPVAARPGRAPVHELARDLNPRAARWAVLTPLLQALDALGLHAVPAESLLEQSPMPSTARPRPAGPRRRCSPTPPSRWRSSSPSPRPVIVGAGALASVAARSTADVLQLGSPAPAVGVSLPDGAGRAGALLRGAGPRPATRTSSATASRTRRRGRARLLVIGDDGDAGDPSLGARSGAQVQLDEVAARRPPPRCGGWPRTWAYGCPSVDVPDGAPLARFAAAAAFGEFTAAYLAFGLGLDPGAPDRPSWAMTERRGRP